MPKSKAPICDLATAVCAFAKSAISSANSAAETAASAALEAKPVKAGIIVPTIVLPKSNITPNKVVVLSAKMPTTVSNPVNLFIKLNISFVKSPKVAPSFWYAVGSACFAISPNFA